MFLLYCKFFILFFVVLFFVGGDWLWGGTGDIFGDFGLVSVFFFMGVKIFFFECCGLCLFWVFNLIKD